MPSTNRPRRADKHPCADCGKPNAVGRARLCPTCKRKHRKASAIRSHEKAVQDKYGLEPGEYDALYAAQGGRCAICKRATGKSRRLAVDHNHETGEVRGLLCALCNHWLIGRVAHDDVDVLRAAIDYLLNPPAREVLNEGQPEARHHSAGSG